MAGYGDSATWPRHPINQHLDPREPEAQAAAPIDEPPVDSDWYQDGCVGLPW